MTSAFLPPHPGASERGPAAGDGIGGGTGAAAGLALAALIGGPCSTWMPEELGGAFPGEFIVAAKAAGLALGLETHEPGVTSMPIELGGGEVAGPERGAAGTVAGVVRGAGAALPAEGMVDAKAAAELLPPAVGGTKLGIGSTTGSWAAAIVLGIVEGGTVAGVVEGAAVAGATVAGIVGGISVLGARSV